MKVTSHVLWVARWVVDAEHCHTTFAVGYRCYMNSRTETRQLRFGVMPPIHSSLALRIGRESQS